FSGANAMNTELNPPTLGNKELDIQEDLNWHFNYTLGRFGNDEIVSYMRQALCFTVRDRLMQRWRETREQRFHNKAKHVYYLSLEFLLGRSLNNAILNLDVEEAVSNAVMKFGCELEEVEMKEKDAGLGNGG